MKIAFVIQRCSPEIFAGAERLVYQLGMNFSEFYDIEILTTRAKDASTWKNYYKEGLVKINNLKIRRFTVDKERDPRYVSLSKYLDLNPHDLEKGVEFIDTNGPVCSGILDFIKKNKDNYDLFIFFGYIYWLTNNALPLVKDKSLFFPQAHDEPWIRYKIFEKVFDAPLGLLFQTNAEKEFVQKRFPKIKKPNTIVGHGFDTSVSSKDYTKSKMKVPKNYLLYIGRISAGKGCQTLSDYFNRYIATHDNNIELVFVGTLEHALNNMKGIIFENLDDNKKFFLLQNCKAFVMPSAHESLNLACLEAWLFKKPVLVNANSPVLKEHCLNSQGGLFYKSFEEFSECLDLILINNSFSDMLGHNGENYVKENYNWKSTREKYDVFFKQILQQLNN